MLLLIRHMVKVSRQPTKLYQQSWVRLALIMSLFMIAMSVTGRVMALDFDPNAGDTYGLINDKTGTTDTITLGTTVPTKVALNLVNTALSLLAALCLGLLVYGGFLWVWARGSEEEIRKAKDIIQGTIIGLIITLAALGITTYVFTTVANITGATVSTT